MNCIAVALIGLNETFLTFLRINLPMFWHDITANNVRAINTSGPGERPALYLYEGFIICVKIHSTFYSKTPLILLSYIMWVLTNVEYKACHDKATVTELWYYVTYIFHHNATLTELWYYMTSNYASLTIWWDIQLYPLHRRELQGFRVWGKNGFRTLEFTVTHINLSNQVHRGHTLDQLRRVQLCGHERAHHHNKL